MSDTRELFTTEIKTKIKSVVAVEFSGGQLLSVCVVKGASLLAGFENGDFAAKRHWKKAQPEHNEKLGIINSDMTNFVRLGDVAGWWSATTDDEYDRVYQQVIFASKIMVRKSTFENQARKE